MRANSISQKLQQPRVDIVFLKTCICFCICHSLMNHQNLWMASSSDQSITTWKHDVFVCFRGSDTRYGFTNYLYHALRAAGVNVFIDKKLKRGEVISFALCQVIERSRISIVVFSQGFATSFYCLDEVVKILQCKESKGQLVLPVFYKIDLADVEKQTGFYEEAFAVHEAKFQDKIQIWKSSLAKAASLSGWRVDNRDEAKIIRRITEAVLTTLSGELSNVNSQSRILPSTCKGSLPKVGEKKEALRRKLQELESTKADIKQKLENSELKSGKMEEKDVQNWLTKVGSVENEAENLEQELEESGWNKRLGNRLELMIQKAAELIDQKGQLVLDQHLTVGDEIKTAALMGQNFKRNIRTMWSWLKSEMEASEKTDISGFGPDAMTTAATIAHNKLL